MAERKRTIKPKTSAPVFPDSPASLIEQAKAALVQQEYERAKALYAEAMKQGAVQPGVLMGYAKACNRSGSPKEALPQLAKLWQAVGSAKAPRSKKGGTALKQTQAEILAEIAYAYEQLGQFPQALQTYRQAAMFFNAEALKQRIDQLAELTEKPQLVGALLERARQLAQQQNLEDAAKVFQAALALNPDSAEALYAYGVFLRDQGQWDDALSYLQQATLLAPNRPDIYNDIGVLFYRKNDAAGAERFYQRALRLKEDFLPAMINLGVLRKQQNRLEEAELIYRRALTIEADNPVVLNNLGNVLRLRGQLAEARALVARALEIAPNYRDAQQNLALLEQA